MTFPLQRKHQRFFLLGRYPAENRIPVAGIIQVFFCLQCGGVHISVPSLQARAFGDHGDGQRIITGYDPAIHALLPEIPKRLIHAGTDLIRENT